MRKSTEVVEEHELGLHETEQSTTETSHMARCVTFAVARIRVAYF